MTSKWITSLISGVALIGMTLSSTFPAAAEQAPDKNGPGVTRVSVVQGSVVVQRGDSNKQVAAVVNAPLLPGDYISTGASSRGELQFDGSTAVRLGGNVQARITNDDPNNRQLQLADGTIVVGLVRNTGTVQVDTPSVTRSREPGRRLSRLDRQGRLELGNGAARKRGSRHAAAHLHARVRAERSSRADRPPNPSITYAAEVGYDSFDDFNAKRDQTMIAALNASPNLNPDIAGYDNLGAYGQWQDVAGYGQVGFPINRPAGLPTATDLGPGETATAGLGWPHEPWGWAPYHYGRWFYANGYGWAWYPPAYSAYSGVVARARRFLRFRRGRAFRSASVIPTSAGIRSRRSCRTIRGIRAGPGAAGAGAGAAGVAAATAGGTRIVNVTHITNIYRYFPHGGVHGTSVGNFQHGTISGHTFAVNSHNISGHVGMIHGAVPVTPTRDSLGFGGRAIERARSRSRRPSTRRGSRRQTGRWPDACRSTSSRRRSRERSRATRAHNAAEHDVAAATSREPTSGHA